MRQHQRGEHPVSLMCVAAPADRALLEQWERHLLPLTQTGVVTVWSEHHLQAGANRTQEMFARLEQAACIVLLLSADFFACEECLTLMEHGLERQREGIVAIIPLLVRPVAWQDTPLGMLPCLPANGVPITTWEHPDEGWRQVVIGLERLLGLPVHVSSSTTRKGAATDRERMLRRLRRNYQASLDGSLQGIAWMELNLSEHPDAVRNATHLLQRLPNRTERVLPVGTRVLSVYDQAEEELLILGAPGSGKSTLLLGLALDLVARAEADAAHPMPVIVPLSSWAQSRLPLADWLVEQFARIYDVPRKLGKLWVAQGQVLPLLDGLDEMEEAACPLCITAINTYHAEHLTALVVCSRHTEYDVAASRERMLLQNAVVIQALTQEQVEQAVRQGGEALAALRGNFTENPTLRELATTPLMLSVLMLAYRGTSIGDLPKQETVLEERVWTDYVERMVRQKGADRSAREGPPVKRYPLAQTCACLSWLAQQMRAHNQTLFYGESLQENWLPASQQQAGNWLMIRLPAILLGTLSSLLLITLAQGNLTDPVEVLQVGLVGSFLGWCLGENVHRNAVPVTNSLSRSWWKHFCQVQFFRLLSAGLLALFFAATLGLYNVGPDEFIIPTGRFDYMEFAASFRLQDELVLGICIFIGAWLLSFLLAHVQSLSVRLSSRTIKGRSRVLEWDWRVSLGQAWLTGTILGTTMAFISALAPCYECSGDPTYTQSLGLTAGANYGLCYGIVAYLASRVLGAQTGTIRLMERVHWTWRGLFRFRHLKTSLVVTLVCMCFFGLISWLSYDLNGQQLNLNLVFGMRDELFQWLRGGWRSDGLSNGLGDGLGYGLGCGLSYWLLLGLYRGMISQHLEDQDRRRFNQRLHRSLRNSLLFSLAGAGIILLIAVLTNGLSRGLSYGMTHDLDAGLSTGLSAGLDFGQLLFLCSWLVLCAATGGLTILRHYLLRVLLARSRIFPLHTQRFLDDVTARVLLRRVGGGYGFVHRRLLDYFAARPALPGEAPASRRTAVSRALEEDGENR